MLLFNMRRFDTLFWFRCVLMEILGTALFSPTAIAFQINPWSFAQSQDERSRAQVERQDITDLQHSLSGQDKDIAAAVTEHLWQPVHEELALRSLALTKFQARNSDGWEPLASTSEGRDLIYGVRWNDSPYVTRTKIPSLYCNRSGSLLGKNPICWGQQFVHAKSHPELKDPKLTTFIGRSHFYDMQFLHAMGPSGLEASKIKDQVLMWAELVALLHSESINESTTIADTGKRMTARGRTELESIFPGNPKLPDNKNMEKWQVGGLFLPPGPERSARLKNVALGSFLHIVQDSFAPGHVSRAVVPLVKLPWGAISEFHSYRGQDTEWHACHDENPIYASWEANRDDLRGPIAIGAKVIGILREANVKSPADLQRIRDRIGNEFLVLADGARKASPGDHSPPCLELTKPNKVERH